jgi:16S rRNA (cytidine1402-2'-O)-methyltransferase
MIQKGKILLFPCPISEGKSESLSLDAISWLHKTTSFAVERAKTARHFIKSIHHPIPIAQLNILEISDDKKELDDFLQATHHGINIGVISEAGCPGVADPGAEVVAWAHKNDIKVVPFVGPSSILLALMASGLNGQHFAFNGYLSNKKPDLINQLKALEQKVQKTGQTEIFMETPYRNNFIIEACLQTLSEQIRLCIACDINGPEEDIRQMKIIDWKKAKTREYHKRPCIYLMGK